MAQKLFHESIVDLIKQMNPTDVMSFVTICKLIETTEVPKGHREIEDALDELAESGGHQFMDELLAAIRVLQIGGMEAAFEDAEVEDDTPGGTSTKDDYFPH